MKKIISVLLAGGSGTRLWPVSRRSYPKQFSKIIRQHIDDIVVLAFTELPETRKIEVVATISGEAES